jgi:hypothetical protein
VTARVVAVALLGAVLTAGGARSLAAQGVMLEMRPRAGDTLHLRLDQDVEVVATSKMRGRDSTWKMARTTRVHSRSIVERADRNGATLIAITDSAVVRDGAAAPRRAMSGTRLRLHVAPDGATHVLDAGGVLSPEASALVSQMPATLPGHALEIGDSWQHTVLVPIPGLPAGAPAGKLVATFHLDSMSRYGDVAFVSMRGALARPTGGVALPQGGRFESSGTVIGQLQVDRRRGWLTSMRATIDVRSVLTPSPASGAAPMHVRTQVTQWLRAVDPVDKR